MDVDDVTATPISRVEGPSDKVESAEPSSMSGEPRAADYDPAFLQTVLRNLPGVDPQNEEVLKAIESLAGTKQGEESDKEEKKDDAERKK